MVQTLDALPRGRAARVTNEPRGGMGERLKDLGFTRGACVSCLYAGPFGNPRAYAIRGAVVALRNEDARGVEVAIC